jgi:type VI secretion system secreted protein VgrG
VEEHNNLQIAFAAKLKADVEVRYATVRESMSDLFRVEVTVMTTDPNMDLNAFVGRGGALRVGTRTAGNAWRVWAGVVSEMELTHEHERGESEYRVVIVPTLWRTTLRKNSRIYQHLNTPDIIEKLLGEWDIIGDWKKVDRAAYRKHEYCVQYGETDYAFISRLLEEAGISFYFENAKPGGKGAEITRVVFNDAPEKNTQREFSLAYVGHQVPAFGAPDFAASVALGRRVRPGKYTLRDYDFRLTPDTQLYATTQLLDDKKAPAHEAAYEIYEYGPSRMWWDVGNAEANPPSRDKGHAGTIPEKEWKELVDRALASARRGDFSVDFRTNAIDLGPGVIVAINQGSDTADHPHPYLAGLPKLLVTGIELEAKSNGDWIMTSKGAFADEPYRPARVTPKPRIFGVQSALVVGGASKQIDTDELGRVRVQFHWDREGKYDDNSSCWMRVSQPWAGGAYGVMNIPRVGHEVLVTFFEGDPDRPVITGRLYNAATGQPLTLPKSRTVSYWRSDTSLNGSGYNEISFEDAKGSEMIHVQAQKDLTSVVKNSERADIGVSRAATVGSTDVLHVGKTSTIVVGESYTTNAGATATIRVGKKTEIRLTDKQIVLSTGDASLSIHEDGVFLNATGEIHLHAGSGTDISSGGPITLESAANLVIQGGPKTDINPGGKAPTSPSPKAAEDPTRKPSSPQRGKVNAPPFLPQGGGTIDAPKGITDIELIAPDGGRKDTHRKRRPPVAPQHLGWIAITLHDDAGDPVPGARYVVTLPDGSKAEGMLDSSGKARVENIPEGTCQVTFPDYDKDSWHK